MSLSLNIEQNLAGLDVFLEEVFEAEAEFAAAEIAKEVRIMRAGGIDDDVIRQTLEADFAAKGRIFGRIDNSVRGHVVGSIIAASNGAQQEVYRDAGITDELRRWIVVNLGPNAAATPCPDCIPRQDRVETIETWQAIGEPGTGWSVCKQFCYCLLIPEVIEMEGRQDILT